ncbi:MAG: hypothetical protein ACYDHH_19255 [Solirubrobacteraceae bacterium]
MLQIPRRLSVTTAVLGGAVALAACGSSSSSSKAPAAQAPAKSTASAAQTPSTSTTSTGVNPNQRESLPPGDIPDTIAYVPFHDKGLGLTISSPEGWARSVHGGALSFAANLNEIQVSAKPAATAPTATSVRSAEVPAIAHSVGSFKLQSISTVSRTSGPAVRIAYLGDSKPDPVTGKIGTLAFERYDFFHNGREVVVLVSSPLGSDNVDPWRKVTNSLTFP